MTKVKKINLNRLKEMYWDYDYPASGEEIFRFILGEHDIPYLRREQVVARMLVYIRWYELIDIFGLPTLKSLMNNVNAFPFIANKEMRENYEYVLTVLNRIL